MGKLSFRVDRALLERLQTAANVRRCGVSDVIRLALVAFLDGQHADTGAQRSVADPPTIASDDREAAWLPGPPSPRVSGAARPQLREIPSWEEFKRRRRQGAETSPPATSPPPTPGAA
jgi:hypothetical protein